MTPEEEVAALKAATREAHEAIKDLRAEIRKAKIAQEALLDRLTEAWTDGVDLVIKEGLESYRETIEQAIASAQQAVYARFDQVADVLLGEDRATVRKGDESLVDTAKRIRRRRQS